MQDGVSLKYGRVNEVSAGAGLEIVVMAAAQAVKAASGRFIYMVAGAATLVVAGADDIWGVLNTHEHTPTVGDKFGVDIDLNGVYRIPVNTGTYAEGMKGDFCDLSIATGIQGAALETSTKNHVIIVDGDLLNNNWVDVRMNPNIWGTADGADD